MNGSCLTKPRFARGSGLRYGSLPSPVKILLEKILLECIQFLLLCGVSPDGEGSPGYLSGRGFVVFTASCADTIPFLSAL